MSNKGLTKKPEEIGVGFSKPNLIISSSSKISVNFKPEIYMVLRDHAVEEQARKRSVIEMLRNKKGIDILGPTKLQSSRTTRENHSKE